MSPIINGYGVRDVYFKRRKRSSCEPRVAQSHCATLNQL
jgi:hypothetical protein